MAKKTTRSAPVWYRVKFDLEGLGFGGLAFILAIIVMGIPYVGGVLSIVFWIAFLAIMFASRDSERTSPSGKQLVLSPCDGVIADISSVMPPRELRWDVQEVTRVRIASSPFSINGIRAPITGSIESILEEDGAPSALALNADNADLREAFVLISGEDGVAGLRVATGGLGPRLDIDLEAGDGVRGGRKIGVRRLGGWCDVFVPTGAEIALQTGMTVVGGETVLTHLSDLAYEHRPFTSASVVTEPDPEDQQTEIQEPVSDPVVGEVVSETADDVDAEKPKETPGS